MISSASVLLCDPAVSFLHAHEMGTDVRSPNIQCIPPDIDCVKYPAKSASLTTSSLLASRRIVQRSAGAHRVPAVSKRVWEGRGTEVVNHLRCPLIESLGRTVVGTEVGAFAVHFTDGPLGIGRHRQIRRRCSSVHDLTCMVRRAGCVEDLQ